MIKTRRREKKKPKSRSGFQSFKLIFFKVIILSLVMFFNQKSCLAIDIDVPNVKIINYQKIKKAVSSNPAIYSSALVPNLLRTNFFKHIFDDLLRNNKVVLIDSSWGHQSVGYAQNIVVWPKKMQFYFFIQINSNDFEFYFMQRCKNSEMFEEIDSNNNVLPNISENCDEFSAGAHFEKNIFLLDAKGIVSIYDFACEGRSQLW